MIIVICLLGSLSGKVHFHIVFVCLFVFINQPGQPNKQDSRSIFCFVLSIYSSSWIGGGERGRGKGEREYN